MRVSFLSILYCNKLHCSNLKLVTRANTHHYTVWQCYCIPIEEDDDAYVVEKRKDEVEVNVTRFLQFRIDCSC